MPILTLITDVLGLREITVAVKNRCPGFKTQGNEVHNKAQGTLS
jgi:hypothetical protein